MTLKIDEYKNTWTWFTVNKGINYPVLLHMIQSYWYLFCPLLTRFPILLHDTCVRVPVCQCFWSFKLYSSICSVNVSHSFKLSRGTCFAPWWLGLTASWQAVWCWSTPQTVKRRSCSHSTAGSGKGEWVCVCVYIHVYMYISLSLQWAGPMILW